MGFDVGWSEFSCNSNFLKVDCILMNHVFINWFVD